MPKKKIIDAVASTRPTVMGSMAATTMAGQCRAARRWRVPERATDKAPERVDGGGGGGKIQQLVENIH
jgi:hypothetical protein